MPDLFPTFDVPEIVEDQTESEVMKLKSWSFDFTTGQFHTDGGNKIQIADPWTAWAQWCMTVVMVERFSCLAYSDDIGIETDEIRKQTDRKSAESLLEKNITEALLVNPGTESVRDFVFSWVNDQLGATYNVYPKEGLPFQATVTI